MFPRGGVPQACRRAVDASLSAGQCARRRHEQWLCLESVIRVEFEDVVGFGVLFVRPPMAAQPEGE